jgi:hypothetical protein
MRYVALAAAVSASGCAAEPKGETEPMGDRIMLVAGGFSPSVVALYRANDRVQWIVSTDGEEERVEHGTLTNAGVAELAEATAELADVTNDFAVCGPADGIDIILTLPHEGAILEFQYCATEPPPPELARIDATLQSVADALGECAQSEWVTPDVC